jgi:hypothetical protein
VIRRLWTAVRQRLAPATPPIEAPTQAPPEPWVLCTREGHPTSIVLAPTRDQRTALAFHALTREGEALLQWEREHGRRP